MSKVSEIATSIKEKPFIAIEVVWAIALIFNGVFILLPAYSPTPGSVLAAFTGEPLVSYGIAVLYIITGLVGLWACYVHTKWARNISTTMFFASFFFTVLLRLLTVGFLPFLWIWPLLLAIVAIVDNWNLNWKPS